MSLINDNLLFLKEHYNSIYEILRNRERNKVKYIHTKSKSGDPNLLVDGGLNSFTIHSNYNPYRETEKWITNHKNEIIKAEHICLYGLGFGYYLEKIVEMYPEKKIYIFEPDIEIFLAFLEVRDISKLFVHSNIITFGLGNNDFSTIQFVNYLLSQSYESVTFLVTPIYKNINQSELQKFNEIVSQSIKTYRSNVATNVLYGLKWTENILLNLPSLLHSTSIYRMENVFENIPALIVGSGPSLQEDIKLLKEFKKFALIIAAGSSIQALLKAGIEPHLVVSIDGGESNYDIFKEIDLSTIPLAAGATIKYTILEGAKGPIFHVPLNIDTISYYLFDLFDREPKIYSTTSVTGTAIQLASLFGCSSVILAGQDLSYPNDSYYAPGVNHVNDSILQKRIKDANLSVKNVKGEWNRTSHLMLVTLKDIEDIIKYLGFEKNLSFINTSKNGADIKGAQFVELETLYKRYITSDKYKEIDIGSIFGEHFQPYHSETKEKVKKRLGLLKKELHKIRDILNRMLENMDELNKLTESAQYNKINTILIEIEDKWRKVTNSNLYEHVLQFTMQIPLSIYMRYLPIIIDEQDVIKKGELVYRHLGSLSAKMIQSLDNIESYMEISISKLRK